MSQTQTVVHAETRGVFRGVKLSAIAAAAVVASFVLVPLSQTVGAPAASALAPSCSSNPLGVSGHWKCTFDDEFNGTALNASNWQPQLTATSGYITGGPDCYVDNPNTISVSHGYLNLSVLRVAPFTCVPGYTSSYQAGMVSSDNLFSQTYGTFEVRAKIPGVTVPGLQETLWLWPQSKPAAGNTGEIDFAEFYSQYPTLDIPALHYAEGASDPNATAYDCTINQKVFNTYEVVWTSSSITILINGQTCLVDQPIGGPAPFNVAHFISLTQALGIGTNAPTAATPLPDTTQIDWVRVWSPS